VNRRRTRIFVTVSAAVVIVASLVLARALSLSSDRDGSLAVAQAGLFVIFAVAALTLFAAVVMDFDRWVDTVPPVPKRVARRWVGRVVRRLCRLVAWVLTLYGAVMTWTWSTIGRVLGAVVGRAGSALLWLWLWVGSALSRVVGRTSVGLTVLWAWVVRAGEWLLVRYRAGVGWVWSSAGRGLAWTLDRSGAGLTVLWAWVVRAGEWLLVRYRAGVGWLWSSAGRGLAWTLDRSGAGLTVLWAWVVRVGVAALVRYRTTLRWLWLAVGRAIVWPLTRIGTALTAMWSLLTRVGAAFLGRCRSTAVLLWRVAVGREDEAKRKPLRRWYGAAVDSAFGIPPEGVSLDRVRLRRARRAMPANRPRPKRPAFLDEGSRETARATASSAVLQDQRARYVGRQVTQRGEHRVSEDLLAALDRFQPSRDRSRDRGDRRDS
jgi:hypothetical protein